jgi:glyoxylase-like metal-dependent hydrolase (beta-lactamase superfamily II)
MMEFKVKRLVVAFGLALCAVTSGAAQQGEGGLDVVKVRKNFYMLAGAGGNIGVQIGSDGIVLVNAGTVRATDQVLAELKKLTDLPIRYIINVDAGSDFVGGNEKLSKSGYTIFTNAIGNAGFAGAMTSGGAASILAHDSVLQRMTKDGYSGAAAPTEAFFTPRKALRMNDEGIEIFHQPSAHSDSDSFVLFRGSDVVVTGDTFDMTRFPMIDLAHGGSIEGEIDALNKLIDLTIAPTPYIYKDVGTYVIPGHGRLSEQMEVVDYRDMVVTIRDVVADLIKQGKTLDQIKAAHPALPWETRFGAKTGPWTTDMFIEAIYKSLKATK